MECRGHFSVDCDHSSSLAAPRIQTSVKISLNFYYLTLSTLLHFVSAKKLLVSLNIFCMYISSFLSASSMQGFVQDAAV